MADLKSKQSESIQAETTNPKSNELYRALQEKGYPDEFCREIAYRQMNTDYTATRMLAILSDRAAIIQKKELEHAQATINRVYNEGL